MRKVFACITAGLMSVTPVQAQETDEGLSLMERGIEMLLEGFQKEMEPALDDLMGMAEEIEPALRGFIDEMGPAFADLLGQIEDFSAYHPPEILPNGDIILRRKSPAEIEDTPDGDIEI